MSSKTISVAVTTFNCGKTLPLSDRIKLPQILTSLLSPQSTTTDIVALGFQETVPIWQGAFPETLNTVYIPNLIQTIKQVLQSKFSNDDDDDNDDEYELLGHGTVGAVVLVVFYRKNSIISTRNLQVSKCTRGFADSSLKGVVKISFELQLDHNEPNWQLFHFICCHLNANEGDSYFKARIADCEAVKDLVMKSSSGDGSSNNGSISSHVFILGDLNFRVTKSLALRLRRQPTSEELMTTMKWDELSGLFREKHPVLNGLKEEAITFPPTYKYKINKLTNQYGTLRIPSWCDRIIHTDYSEVSKSSDCKVVAKYLAVPRVESLVFTDHQPVTLLMEVPILPYERSDESKGNSISNMTIQSDIGMAADYVIGYADWFMYKRFHVWFALLVVLYILYRLFVYRLFG